MTEIPWGGPSAVWPARRRTSYQRPGTPTPEPTGEDLTALRDVVATLPRELRGLARHLAPRRLWRIERALSCRTRSLTLILHGTEDPHNQAAVLRTAEGLGVQEVHVVRHADAPWRPSPGISQNAHKWLDVREHTSFSGAADSCRRRGLALRAAALGPHASDAAEVDWTAPTALILGHEARGLPAWLLAQCDGVVALPMYGLTVSYNLSVAAAMLLATAVLARRSAWGSVGDLTEEQRMQLRRRFYRLALPPRTVRALDGPGGHAPGEESSPGQEEPPVPKSPGPPR